MFKSVLGLEIDEERDNSFIHQNCYEITIEQRNGKGGTLWYRLHLPELYITRSFDMNGIEQTYLRSKELKTITWLVENNYDIKDLSIN